MAEVFAAGSIEEVVAFLAGHRGVSLPIAGGTDVMVDKRNGRVHPEWLVDLTSLEALAGIEFREGGKVVRIGSMTRIRSLELDPVLGRRAAALVEAARLLGSVQIRTMATVGGNLCHGTPSAEMPPPLLVHDADCEVAGPSGRRVMPLVDLFAGPGRTVLEPDELLVALELRLPDSGVGSCYLRQTVRWSMDLAGVGVAAAVEVDGSTVTKARVALGAVAPVPLLVAQAANALVGTELDAGAAAEAGRRAAAACSPITDARGTESYRRQVVAVLMERAARIAWLRATGSWPAGVPAPANGVLPSEVR